MGVGGKGYEADDVDEDDDDDDEGDGDHDDDGDGDDDDADETGLSTVFVFSVCFCNARLPTTPIKQCAMLSLPQRTALRSIKGANH